MASPSSSRNLFQKIAGARLEEGDLVPGREIALRIDQTLTSEEAGPLCYLQFEAMGLDRVATETSLSAVESTRTGQEETDYLETVAQRFGLHFSRPGNGPAHGVHLERFAAPGRTLIGPDRRVVAGGALAMLAIPATALDVAVAMGGGAFHLRCPEVVQVFLRGKLRPLVSCRDVALEILLRRKGRGALGKVLEFCGPGVKTLSAEERATIALLGAEVGALTTLFPSDDRTRAFLQGQKRIKAWRRIEADANATYDDREDVDLGAVEPMIAGPAPIGVRPIRELAGRRLREAAVGVGGHVSLRDLCAMAAVLRGRKVQGASPLFLGDGTTQVRRLGEEEGVSAALAAAGTRNGALGAPASGGVVLQVEDAESVLPCLASVESAAAGASAGQLVDPRSLKRVPKPSVPRRVQIDDSLLVRAGKDGARVEIRRGPQVAPLPPFGPMPADLTGRVLLKGRDDLGSAHVLPADVDPGEPRPGLLLLAELVFSPIDDQFSRRAKEWGGGCIVAGRQYGAGERHELAALAPRLVGVRFVLARSFARSHLVDLVHFGILPLTFQNARDYDALARGDDLHVPEAAARLKVGRPVIVENRSSGRQIEVRYDLTDREREILVEGGLLPFTRRRARKGKEAVAA